MNEDGFGLHVEDIVLRDIILRHERRRDILDRRLPATIQRQLDRAVLVSRDLRGRRAEFVEEDAQVVSVVW